MALTADLHELLIQNVIDYAICMLDPDGRVVSWNSGAQRIKGYTAEEIIGEHFSRFYTDEDRAAGMPAKALRLASETGRFTAEAWRVRKDGSRFWAMVVIDPIFQDGRLIGFAKITRDMTERRETQMQLEQSREQLFQSQKMEAIGHLTGGLAHDFNNLLTGISGSLELLSMRIAQGQFEDMERYIATARGAASRAAALTHRLLAFARRQTLDAKVINPNQLITDMEDLLRRTVGPGVGIKTVLGIGLWTTLCDPNQLESAVLNLCINGHDAMPGGGQLTIETANACIDERGGRQRDMQPGQYVTISVTDTGTGMPSDVMARAFEPFFTTKPFGQGTGLGLSMIYGFAKQSNGQVRLHSEVGVGTTARIYLPRHQGDVISEEAMQPELPETADARAGETVLVVDDEPSVRMLLTEVLEGMGYATIEAADSISGLRVLQSDVRIDLLVTDVGLPGGMNGRQMSNAARQNRPRLKVLFITGYAETAVIGSGDLEPGMHVLTKPFAMDKLVSRIKEVMASA